MYSEDDRESFDGVSLNYEEFETLQVHWLRSSLLGIVKVLQTQWMIFKWLEESKSSTTKILIYGQQ